MPTQLTQHLCSAYDVVDARQITIDQRDSSGMTPDFCQMFVTINDDDSLTLRLHNVPLSRDVRTALEEHGGTVIERSGVTQATVALTVDDSRWLRELAATIRRVVGRGAPRYDNPNWKWICRTTAESLELLAKHLRAGRSLLRRQAAIK